MKEKELKPCHLLLGVFGLVLIILFGFTTLYTINNYNKFTTYILKSTNSDFEVAGIINITPYYDVLLFNRIQLLFGDNYGNTKLYRYQTTLMIDNHLVVKKGADISNYKPSDFEDEEPKLLSNVLKELDGYVIENHDYDEQIKRVTANSKISFIIDYIDADYKEQTIEIPIIIEKSFSNNKIFYEKGPSI